MVGWWPGELCPGWRPGGGWWGGGGTLGLEGVGREGGCCLQGAKRPARVQQRKSKDLGPGPQNPRGSTLCCGDNKDEQRVTGLFHLLRKSTAELYSVRVFVTSGRAWLTPGAAGFGSWDLSPRGWLWVPGHVGGCTAALCLLKVWRGLCSRVPSPQLLERKDGLVGGGVLAGP